MQQCNFIPSHQMFSNQLEVSFLKLQLIVYIACRETEMLSSTPALLQKGP